MLKGIYVNEVRFFSHFQAKTSSQECVPTKFKPCKKKRTHQSQFKTRRILIVSLRFPVFSTSPPSAHIRQASPASDPTVDAALGAVDPLVASAWAPAGSEGGAWGGAPGLGKLNAEPQVEEVAFGT